MNAFKLTKEQLEALADTLSPEEIAQRLGLVATAKPIEDLPPEMMQPTRSKSQLRQDIRGLDISKYDKGVIDKLVDVTTKIGNVVVKVGQWLVEMLLAVAAHFPFAVSGLAIGLCCQFILASIPLLGMLLGPTVGALLTLGCLIAGFSIDLIRQYKPLVETYAQSRLRVA